METSRHYPINGKASFTRIMKICLLNFHNQPFVGIDKPNKLGAVSGERRKKKFNLYLINYKDPDKHFSLPAHCPHASSANREFVLSFWL